MYGEHGIDDPRRMVLIRALSAGVLGTCLTPAQAITFGIFGSKPSKLPETQSIYRLSGDVSVNRSAATLDTLRPFFVPAYYAGRWWHQQNPNATAQAAAGLNRGKTAAGKRATAANPNCKPTEELCPLLADWKNVAGTKVVVWYLTANEATDATKTTEAPPKPPSDTETTE